MVKVIDNNFVPDNELILAYWLVLQRFDLAAIDTAIDELIGLMDTHITPAHIRKHIQGDTKPLSDSEKRTAAAEQLALPYWQRMGFESHETYQEANHKKWEESQK